MILDHSDLYVFTDMDIRQILATTPNLQQHWENDNNPLAGAF